MKHKTKVNLVVGGFVVAGLFLALDYIFTGAWWARLGFGLSIIIIAILLGTEHRAEDTRR